jgi:hypothetical protein
MSQWFSHCKHSTHLPELQRLFGDGHKSYMGVFAKKSWNGRSSKSTMLRTFVLNISAPQLSRGAIGKTECMVSREHVISLRTQHAPSFHK